MKPSYKKIFSENSKRILVSFVQTNSLNKSVKKKKDRWNNYRWSENNLNDEILINLTTPNEILLSLEKIISKIFLYPHYRFVSSENN